MTICGYTGSEPIYRIEIHVDIYHRLLVLAKEPVEGLPDWMDLGQSSIASKRIIATTNPNWFLELTRIEPG